MRSIRPASESLADVLLLCPALDAYTDPYRHIGDLTVEVAFEEYIDFVLHALMSENFMYLDTRELKRLAGMAAEGAQGSRIALYRAYVLDVCAAGIKELVLSHRAGSDATAITYAPPYGAVVLGDSQLASLGGKDFYDYLWRMRVMGYATPKNMSADNRVKFVFYIYSVRAALSRYNGFFKAPRML
jgi:hypothetical protein